MMTHPIQEIVVDEKGRPRFKENKIVSFLLEHGGHDMNSLARLEFSDEDREQFAQLIGYSVGGLGELSYVTDDTYNKAAKMADELLKEREQINEILSGEPHH